MKRIVVIGGLLALAAFGACSSAPAYWTPREIIGRENVPPEHRIDPRTRARGARGGDVETGESSSAATAASPPLLSLATDNMPSPPAPGYRREWIEWSDGGYDSTYDLPKEDYEPQKHETVVLRVGRTGVRVEDVPENWDTLVLLCVAAPRSRNRHFDFWSNYLPGACGPVFDDAAWRARGAACVLRYYDPPNGSVIVNRTWGGDKNQWTIWCNP